ncbi:MAG: glutamate 5-kinase [bacterium]|nr:glutamate 5-kinase [bacterium]
MERRAFPSGRKSRRIVVKIGTSILSISSGRLDFTYVSRIVKELCSLRKEIPLDVILVTSGAVLAGMEVLKLERWPKTIPLKQACASIGQSRLMESYQNLFSTYNQTISQILLTHQDLSSRRSYINIYHTLLTLLKYKIIPIVNENDTVAVEELKFGDNDTLSALVASSIESDMLIILTDTDGLYDTNNRLIKRVTEINPDLFELAKGKSSPVTSGGMHTKLRAAEIVTKSGGKMVIANGRKDGVVTSIINGEDVGTLFLPKKGEKIQSSKKRWIVFNLVSQGNIVIDEGAKIAIKEQGKSLLPKGILSVKGEFESGDAVTLIDESSRELAKGLVNYTSRELLEIKGKHTKEIEGILGYKYYDEIIHRDNLVLL